MRRTLLIALMLGTLASPSRNFSGPTQPTQDDQKPKGRPLVRVVSPPGSAFVIGTSSESKILVVVEIVDQANAGILTYDSGLPRFVEPNRNTEAFVGAIIARNTYTNGHGEAVIQLFSEIPVRKLRTGEIKMSPPVDFKTVPPGLVKSGFSVESDAVIDAADFVFQVKDRNGEKSEVATLAVGFAQDFFRGPFLAPPAGMKGHEGPPPPDEDSGAPPS